jgi:hypothetical protein
MRYQYNYHCHRHGNLGEKSTCHECAMLPPEERPKKSPQSKLQQVKKRAPIGEYWDHYKKFIDDKYRQHRWQLRANGLRYCGGAMRDPKRLLQMDPFSICLERDYSDRMSPEYNKTPMSRGLGGGQGDFGMEGILYHCMGEDQTVQMHWHAFLSEEKQQDARTSYANSCKFFECIQNEKKLLPRGGNSCVYIKSDGCPKQYKCANSVKMNCLLADRFGFQVDWMVNCAHHGKCLVDALAGRDKYDLRNGYIYGIDSAQRDHNGIAIKETDKACKFLGDPTRGEGDYKHNYLIAKHKCTTRSYQSTDYASKHDIPGSNCKYKIVSGFDKGQKNTPEAKQNGIHEMHHFRYHPMLPKGMAVCRRMPCLCEHCMFQLNHPWDPTIQDPKDQPMFQNNPNCEFHCVMGELNDWKFITVEPAKKRNRHGQMVPQEDPEQLEKICQEALESIAMRTSMEIEPGGYGAINADEEDAPDGFYLVKWKGQPYTLQAPAMVECCGDGDGDDGAGMMPAGTLVCKGIYYDRIRNAKGWYQPLPSTPAKPPEVHLFWLNHVLCGDIQVQSGSQATNFLPPRQAQVFSQNKPFP